MNNDDFITKVIEATRFLAEASPQQMLAVKNKDLDYLYCSPYLLELMGVKEKDVLGKKIWLPLYDNDTDFKKILAEEDQMIIKSREPRMLLKINRFTIGLTPYICNKAPLINPTTQQVVGILFQGLALALMTINQQFLKTATFVHKNNLPPDSLPHLSKREKQVIFFFMVHLSSQEIADMLYQIEGKKIAKSTIDSLFNDQLYHKFNVYSRPALYKKLQTMGYETLIPKELLESNSLFLPMANIY